ncbi:hypothetical protein RD792_009218 [Penstemon davidsonii]|uniref:HSF-type DNA-binding domain-containing protein n=1 Tax=Penstemon davidsonii TaxID=160366 RepID=A0ABR0DBC1_9LAMI|nr:hypothetical protein RD792_009218 [Penstemon davidsonii]
MESASTSSTVTSENSGGGKTIPPPAPMPAPNAPPPFLVKTYEMVDDPNTNSIVSWSPMNNSFVVWDSAEFGRSLLPKYFKHNNFSSFVRQLNTYGFRKVDPDRWEFANEGFLRGQKHLLKTISRRKPVHGQPQNQHQANGQNSSVGACVEVGKFGLEEEVERLKRDKNVLMQELVRLRQQQQSTDGQLQTMVQRLQGMEQRQQQMMSFLAKAVNSPGFLAQFMQQQPNEGTRRITEGNKKRRLKQDDISDNGTIDGQIVKYQPLINEAAKAMLRQIVKLDSSPSLENFGNSTDSLLIGDGSSAPPALDSASSPNRVSGVTLQEVTPAFGPSFVTSGSPISEVQSPSLGPPAQIAANQFSGTSPLIGTEEVPPVTIPPTSAIMPELSEMVDIIGPETGNGIFLDNEKIPLEIGGFSPDANMEWENGLFDDIQELPGVGDPFWEKFLQSPTRVEIEMDSSPVDDLPDGNEAKLSENGWDKSQNMAELTEQMGLLTSDAKKV